MKLESKVICSDNNHTRPGEEVVKEIQKLDLSIEII